MSADPASVDLTIYQGAYWSKSILWEDSNDVPIPLAGYTARMQIRKKIQSDTVIALLATSEVVVRDGDITIGPSDGVILLELDAAATAALPATPSDHRWFYDLEMVPAGGQVRRLMMGRITVSLEVTR